ncbi:hypothetical protein BSL78_28078 [Apostichopus japonicus]|uniref:Integrase catalytic domain-containing protein n=1 Tax=Stichopus japonicus TaxID=307972 RepID=A0A2G8JH66_STIJA|nr:hypothetical protein BSL78_28078 [Apostichopus japonicus]
MVTLGRQRVSVLRDTGCTTVVARRKFVDPSKFTGANKRCVLLDGTRSTGPRPELESPQFESSGKDLGSVSGAVETRAQKQKREKPLKPLRTAKSEELDISREELIQAQKDEPSFAKLYDIAKTGNVKMTRGGNEVRFTIVNNVLFRKFKSAKSRGDKEFRQVVMPKRFRNKVLSVGHEAPLSGHLGVKKTHDRITSNFYWPGIQNDVKMFCVSCDICQRTVSKGRISKVPLGRMPLIDTPFHRVAIDLVGPLAPVSDRGNRYVLTLVDYATRFPEAVALPSIETERVAEALLEIFTRVGFPKEILTDMGSQFTSDLMREISRVLQIKQLTTTPYHPICNGLVEKFNEFYCYVVGEGILSPQPDKVQKVLNASIPTTKKEVRSFMGLVGYYSRFIPNFAAISAPLTDLTRGSNPNRVKWGSSQGAAFDTLKSRLASAPILHLPDMSKPFILRCDASDVGVGSVLMQEEDGVKYPICFASRKLQPREVKYATIEKECLAVVWAMEKFQIYLYGLNFCWKRTTIRWCT